MSTRFMVEGEHRDVNKTGSLLIHLSRLPIKNPHIASKSTCCTTQRLPPGKPGAVCHLAALNLMQLPFVKEASCSTLKYLMRDLPSNILNGLALSLHIHT